MDKGWTTFAEDQLSGAAFEHLKEQFWARTHLNLVYSDLQGNLLHGIPNCNEFPCNESCRLARYQAVQAVREGKSRTHSHCPSGYLFIAVPVYLNNSLIGTLIAIEHSGPRDFKNEDDYLAHASSVQQTLIELTIEYNLISPSHQTIVEDFLHSKPHSNPSSNGQSQPLNWEQLEQHFLVLKESDNKSLSFDTVRSIGMWIEHAQACKHLSLIKGIATRTIHLLETRFGPRSENLEQSIKENLIVLEKVCACATAAEVQKELMMQANLLLRPNFSIPHPTQKQEWVQQLFTYIENHIDEGLPRDALARKLGLSSSRLSHLVKEETGHTLSEILKRFRMDKAKQLLIEDEHLSISDIAGECGYFDHSHFTKVFHRYCGITPAEYRKMHSHFT